MGGGGGGSNPTVDYVAGAFAGVFRKEFN